MLVLLSLLLIHINPCYSNNKLKNKFKRKKSYQLPLIFLETNKNEYMRCMQPSHSLPPGHLYLDYWISGKIADLDRPQLSAGRVIVLSIVMVSFLWVGVSNLIEFHDHPHTHAPQYGVRLKWTLDQGICLKHWEYGPNAKPHLRFEPIAFWHTLPKGVSARRFIRIT